MIVHERIDSNSIERMRKLGTVSVIIDSSSGVRNRSDLDEFSEACAAVFFSSRRRHTRLQGDWSSDVCSSDLTGIPPFIATLGTMVAARGFAKWFTNGTPVSMLTEEFAALGSGAHPVLIFLVLAAVFHTVLRHTRFGKFTYAIGANRQAAVVSGINVRRHLVWVYMIAGVLSGIAGTVTAARAISGQSGMGVMYELDAIAAVVIGGTSLAGGVGRITGTVIGVLILGVMTSGFTFIRIDAYYQEMVKGAIIVAAVVADQYRNKKARR